MTVKDLLMDHLEHSFEKEAWQPPLGVAVMGLTAEQAGWKPSPERHSIWQIVRHVIRWKRATLQALAGDPPNYEQVTRNDWQDAAGDQGAWDADVQALKDTYTEFRQRLEALDDEALGRSERWFQGQRQPQPVALRLMAAFTHDIYHAGQIQYLRALQEIPLDRFATAAWDGHLPRLRAVLDAHPDLPTAYTGDGWTGLHIAAYAGQVEVARLLLTRGADIRATSRNAMATTAVHCAITGWQAGRRAEIVTFLLDHGADLDATNAQGNAPLHLAARDGLRETVEVLVRRGANVNIRRNDGATPLRTALKEGHAAIADLLRVHGGVE